MDSGKTDTLEHRGQRVSGDAGIEAGIEGFQGVAGGGGAVDVAPAPAVVAEAVDGVAFRLLWYLREACPSRGTGTSLVAFGDGMEDDALT
ncbi:hypothetical protein [Streptomyces sp. NPDC090445]|uniref:hypothetical protein n=1 Tax=Streptomyces sp. NPDC090445 TaxID=3365963 RepID=UPI0037F6B552